MSRNTEFLTNIQRIIRAHENMLRSICETCRLTLTEITIISFLHNNPEKDTAADIVELRMLSKGNVSQGVESLIQKSLLCRRQDQADRRKIHLSLQPSAAPITREIEAIGEKFHKKVFAGFSEEERRLFVELNNRFIENTKFALEEGDKQ